MKLTIEGYHGLTYEELRFRERFSTVEQSTIQTDFKPEIIIEPVRFSEPSIHQFDLNQAKLFWQFLNDLECYQVSEEYKLHHDFFVRIDRLSTGRYVEDVYAYDLNFVSRLDNSLRGKINVNRDAYVKYKTSPKGRWTYGSIKKALDLYLGGSNHSIEYWGLDSADAACVVQAGHIEISPIGFKSDILGTFVPTGIFNWE